MPGNYTSLFCKLRVLFIKLLSLSIALLLQATAASAHELRPAIMDVGIIEDAPDQLTISLTFSAEAFLADIDLSAVSNTDDSTSSRLYDELRAVPAGVLATTGGIIHRAHRAGRGDVCRSALAA